FSASRRHVSSPIPSPQARCPISQARLLVKKQIPQITTGLIYNMGLSTGEDSTRVAAANGGLAYGGNRHYASVRSTWFDNSSLAT
ncbi:Unknown protein, partial [Striga hermonthica]